MTLIDPDGSRQRHPTDIAPDTGGGQLRANTGCVLGTNVRSRLCALLRGSIAEEVVRSAHCPVMLVQPDPSVHLRRMRPIYRGRRDALLGALKRYLPELRPAGASAGLHVLAWLPPGLNESRVLEEAKHLGVDIDGVDRYRITQRGGPGALIFGYGHLSERAIEQGVQLLARAIESARRSPAGGKRAPELTVIRRGRQPDA